MARVDYINNTPKGYVLRHDKKREVKLSDVVPDNFATIAQAEKFVALVKTMCRPHEAVSYVLREVRDHGWRIPGRLGDFEDVLHNLGFTLIRVNKAIENRHGTFYIQRAIYITWDREEPE